MVDNVPITAGSGTNVASDDIAGVHYQRVKTTWGPDGTANDADVATGKPLPTQIRSATGLIPIGEPTDAKNTATDTTSVSGISIWKQISASVQALVTAFGAALTRAAGAVDANTQRVTLGSDDPAVASLAILDDWDETDRAKVNLIPGQAGITAGAGAVAANTPRVSLASDDPAVTRLGALNSAKETNPDAASADLNALLRGILQSIQDGTITARAEDDASASGHEGLVALARRTDTPANQSGTDGDYEFLQVSGGALWSASAATDKTLAAERVIAGGSEYETVAASQTNQILGGVDSPADETIGDYIEGVLIVPATTSPGAVSVKDGGNTAITIFAGGASSVSNLVPFYVPLGLLSTDGAWQVTTGANVSCIASGKFT